jgi:hypothetical protein
MTKSLLATVVCAACVALPACGGSSSGSKPKSGEQLQAVATQCARHAGHDRAALTSCLKDHGIKLPAGNSKLDDCLKSAGDDLSAVVACGKQ